MNETAVFVAPTTVAEVLDALGGGARVVAGGTDLVVGARQGKAPLPELLVSIHRVESLCSIEESPDGGIRIGALATHDMLASHPVIRDRFTAIADAAAIVGSRATRLTGTIGGNVMNASPAMELGGPLICAGATATLASVSGVRHVPLDALFLGPGRAAASPHELLTAIDLPGAWPSSGSCYARLEYRRQMEIAIVGITARCAVADGVITAARVAITALAPTIRLVHEAEAVMIGRPATAETFEAASAAVRAASTPISDVRASSDYRAAMAAVMAQRVIGAACRRAAGESVAIPASDSLRGTRW
jgi:CO/xanthine dehydrogenase FAD-binding subunit